MMIVNLSMCAINLIVCLCTWTKTVCVLIHLDMLVCLCTWTNTADKITKKYPIKKKIKISAKVHEQYPTCREGLAGVGVDPVVIGVPLL